MPSSAAIAGAETRPFGTLRAHYTLLPDGAGRLVAQLSARNGTSVGKLRERIRLHAGERMSVDAQREAGRCVTEPLLRHLRRRPVLMSCYGLINDAAPVVPQSRCASATG